MHCAWLWVNVALLCIFMPFGAANRQKRDIYSYDYYDAAPLEEEVMSRAARLLNSMSKRTSPLLRFKKWGDWSDKRSPLLRFRKGGPSQVEVQKMLCYFSPVTCP